MRQSACIVITRQQSACLVINPITVSSFAPSYCTPVGLNDGHNIKLVELFKLVGAGLSLVYCLVIRGSTGGFLCTTSITIRCFCRVFISDSS